MEAGSYFERLYARDDRGDVRVPQWLFSATPRKTEALANLIAEGNITEGAEFLHYVGGRGGFEVIRREFGPAAACC